MRETIAHRRASDGTDQSLLVHPTEVGFVKKTLTVSSFDCQGFKT